MSSKGFSALLRYRACTRFMVPSSMLNVSASWAAWTLPMWANRSTAPLWRLTMMLSAFSIILKVTLSR